MAKIRNASNSENNDEVVRIANPAPQPTEPTSNPYENMKLPELEQAHEYLTSLLASTRERLDRAETLLNEVEAREELARAVLRDSTKASDRRDTEIKLARLVDEGRQLERRKLAMGNIIADCERKLAMIPTDLIERERRRQADRVRLNAPRLPVAMRRMI